MTNILVACGIIESHGKILLGKKVKGKHPANLGGRWHFPGGRIKKKEIPIDAVKREIKEETNLDVDVKEQLAVSKRILENGSTVKFFYFLCHPKNNDLKASSDLQDVKWVQKDDVLGLFNQDLINMLPKEVINFLDMSYKNQT